MTQYENLEKKDLISLRLVILFIYVKGKASVKSQLSLDEVISKSWKRNCFGDEVLLEILVQNIYRLKGF